MATSTCCSPNPVTRPAHSPSIVARPSSSRPSSLKKSIVTSRSSTTMPTLSMRLSAMCLIQHVIGQAVAVARLIGVPAPVHVRQVERTDGPQRPARRDEFADRGEAADLDAENVLASGEEIADVFRRHDTALKKGIVYLPVIERMVGGEIGK